MVILTLKQKEILFVVFLESLRLQIKSHTITSTCSIPLQIDRERTGWLGTTITPLPESRCGLDSCRKWRAIKETAGATISLGNVSLGDDHITMKALCGAFLTRCTLTNQSLIRQITQIHHLSPICGPSIQCHRLCL